MADPNKIPWIKHFAAIDKHLDKNEKWLQYPEKDMHNFEQEMDKWNDSFMNNIRVVEKWIGELENKMENY